MASNLTDYKYETESGRIARLRADIDLGTVMGNEPAGTVNEPYFVKISKTNREFGLRPRMLILQRIVTGGTLTVVRTRKLPILTKAYWANPATALLATIDIDGVVWTVYARLGEDS